MADGPAAGVLRGLAWIATALTSGGTVLAWLAGFHWVAELFSHFPMHYLAGASLAAATFLLTRRPRAAVLAALVAASNVVVAWPYTGGRPAPPPGDGGLTLIAWNLQYRNTDFDSAIEYLAGRRPDLLVLSEFTPRWGEALSVLEELYPHRILLPQRNAWGLALYSRFPMSVREELRLVDASSANVRALVETPLGTLQVFGVHLASPTSRRAAALRNAQLAELGRRVREEASLPTLVVGDLNVSPFSPYFGKLLGATGLADARRPFGPHVTWPTSWLPVWVAIDHGLASERVAVTRIVTGAGRGSDHRPLEIRFAIE